EEARPYRAHDVGALTSSVRREIGRLLNTRRHGRAWAAGEGGEVTVLDYGLPDFSSLSAHSDDDRGLLAEAVAEAVAAFEPRLRGVRVRVEQERPEDRALLLRVEGRLVVGTVAEPVSFPLLMPRGGARAAEVHEDEPT
ncbi:MAG TPA: type VI secretion system baseplate subunit TssE, partial [Pyrinomonadaceae bacterium]